MRQPRRLRDGFIRNDWVCLASIAAGGVGLFAGAAQTWNHVDTPSTDNAVAFIAFAGFLSAVANASFNYAKAGTGPAASLAVVAGEAFYSASILLASASACQYAAAVTDPGKAKTLASWTAATVATLAGLAAVKGVYFAAIALFALEPSQTWNPFQKEKQP